MKLRKKTVRPRKIVMYGPPGVGKTEWALGREQKGCRNPVFLDIEDGLGNVNVAASEICKSYDDVCHFLSDLKQEKHDFGTLVVDSVDWLEQLIWKAVCDVVEVDTIEQVDGGFGKGYVRAMIWWQEFLTSLEVLRNGDGANAPMQIILLAHSKLGNVKRPNGESYNTIQPALQERALALLVEWCDELLFADFDVTVTEKRDGARKTNVAIGDDSRVIHTGGSPQFMAKNRLQLPSKLPMEYAAYATYAYARPTQPQTEEGEVTGAA